MGSAGVRVAWLHVGHIDVIDELAPDGAFPSGVYPGISRVAFSGYSEAAAASCMLEVWSRRPEDGDLGHGHRAATGRVELPMREVINTPDAPRSPLYSQGIRAGDQIFVSGMVGIDVTTGRVAGPSIQQQTRQAFANCEAVLLAAGASLADVVDVGVLLRSPDDFAGMNEAWTVSFPNDPPARWVAKLGAVLPDILVSVRMTASLT